jgi:hypothetical protein
MMSAPQQQALVLAVKLRLARQLQRSQRAKIRK